MTMSAPSPWSDSTLAAPRYAAPLPQAEALLNNACKWVQPKISCTPVAD